MVCTTALRACKVESAGAKAVTARASGLKDNFKHHWASCTCQGGRRSVRGSHPDDHPSSCTVPCEAHSFQCTSHTRDAASTDCAA